MLKINPYIFLPLIVFSPLVLSFQRFPELPSKNKPLSFSLQTEFYRTHSNYIKLGQYSNLPNKNFLQYVGFYPSLSYSPFPHYINFKFFANSFYVSSKTIQIRRETFRVSSAGMGLSIYHKLRNFYAGFELIGGMPVYRNFRTPKDLIIGDDSYFVEPGLWLLFQPVKIFYIYSNTAFRYRMNSFSGLLFSQLGGAFETQYMNAGASIDSFFSVTPDRFTNRPEQRWEHLKKINGGSYKFYSVNPSIFFSWTTWMEFKFKPIYTKIYFNLDTLGKNYAKGFSVGMVAKVKWNTRLSIIERRRKRNSILDFNESSVESSDLEKESSYFEEETDPYSSQNSNFNRNNNMKNELKNELRSLQR